MEQIIDQAVNDFQTQLEESQEEFVRDIEELENQGLSSEEILAILGGLIIGSYWLDDLLMKRAVDNYLAATGFMLDDMVFFGKITETELLAFRRLQESMIINYAQSLGEEIRLGLSEGIAGGIRGKRLRESIASRITLNPSRIEGMVGTALATYRRSVNAVMADNADPNTLYSYEGPLDGLTRPICRVMISAGPTSYDDIEAQFPGAFLDGGGFNCRHEWTAGPSSEYAERSTLASEQINENPKKFTKAKTLLEYYRAKNT